MQLADLLELAVQEGVRRHVERRAGVLLPLAVGAMIPGIVHKAMERAHSTEHTIDQSRYNPMKFAALPLQLALPLAQAGQSISRGASNFGSQMAGSYAQSPSGKGTQASGFRGSINGLGAAPLAGVAGGISGGISKVLERMMLGREFGEKKDPFHMGGSAAVQSFGKEMGTTGANLLRDIANKATEAIGHAGDASAREAILGDLKRTDSVLANADDGTLMEAYHTMTRFAPVLSTDKNAVRSFLRQAVMSGSGPDYMSIKLLADSERAVTGGGDKRAAALSPALAELLPSLGRGALMGGGVGAISGALANEDDRTGGAIHGAFGGAVTGGLGGALHGHLSKKTPAPAPDLRQQGPILPGKNPAEHLPFEGMTYGPNGVLNDRGPRGARPIPMGVAPAAYELAAYTPEEALHKEMQRKSYTGD